MIGSQTSSTSAGLFLTTTCNGCGRESSPVKPTHQELSQREQQILLLILENPKISHLELNKKIGINPSAIQKQMNKLKEKGIIKRVGPDKGGHWEVIEK